MDERKYFYLSNGQPVGPLRFEEVVEFYRTGTIHRGTFMLCKDENSWKTLNQLESLHQKIKSTLGTSHLPDVPGGGEGGQYYLGLPGQKVQGPFTTKQVTAGIKSHKYGRQHFIFDSFIDEWVPLYTHPDFDRRRLARLNDVSEPATAIVPVPRKVKVKRLLRNGTVVFMFSAAFFYVVLSNKQVRCALGSSSKCQLLGYDKLKENQLDDALKYFEKSCGKGLMGACHDAGLVKKKQNNGDGALKYFKDACDQKYGPSCFQLALHEPKNSDKALGFVSAGCEYGSGEACLELGLSDLKAHNSLRALKFFKRSCDQKYPQGCNHLSLLMAEVQDKKGQAKALETSCQLGNSEGCAGLGQFYYDEGSMILAEDYLLKACNFESAAGCGGAANLAFLRSDADAGEKLARRACELKDAIGCGLLASFLLDAKQPAAATEYFKKACDLGSGLSCYTLGGVLKANRAPASEVGSAFKKACKANKKYCGKG